MIQDLRYGVRLLRRSPIFTIVAVLSLAIGIAASAAVFSVADAVLFRTLAVHDPDALVTFKWFAGPEPPLDSLDGYSWHRGAETASTSFSLATFEAMRKDGAGLALGLLSASWLSSALLPALDQGPEFVVDLVMDPRVIGFAAAIAIASTVLFAGTSRSRLRSEEAAYLPARRASRVDPIVALRAE